MAKPKTGRKTTRRHWEVRCIWLFGVCIPIGFWPPSNAGLADPTKGLSPLQWVGLVIGKLGTTIAGGIAGGLVQAFKEIVDGVWKSGKGHAWEWVIGGAMLFVFIGSARRIGEGGR